MDIKELQKTIIKLAQEKKWGINTDEINFAEKIALLHGEVSEALEAYRKNNIYDKNGVIEELADVIIRAFHLANIYKADIKEEIQKKIDYNKDRSWDNDQLHKDRDNIK